MDMRKNQKERFQRFFNFKFNCFFLHSKPYPLNDSKFTFDTIENKLICTLNTVNNGMFFFVTPFKNVNRFSCSEKDKSLSLEYVNTPKLFYTTLALPTDYKSIRDFSTKNCTQVNSTEFYHLNQKKNM